ncbi:MAG TPA: ABC transporter ATP-binding protein [Candidatus Obscuribacterales bacterium]
MTTPEPIVQVQNLRKVYDEKTALADVSLAVKRGEIVGLLGANGAGKTTLIHILLGLLKPTSGTVLIFGKDLEHHRISILERCNFSSAYIHLPHNLKVWENLLVFAKLYQVKNARKKIDHLLDSFEVSHLRNNRTGYLSSGEQTRVNLCKALINDPDLLLLDEPTASLDPDIADKVRKLIKRVQEERNMTILYTSHNMRDVEELCDRVLFLHKGNITAEGSPQEIMDRFKQQSLEDVFINIARGGDVEEEEKHELPSG